jgi:hypothetical protein
VKLLLPATPGLLFIQSPFGCFDRVFNIAVDHIRFEHRVNRRTDVGMLCEMFKLNGDWCAAVGSCGEDPS